VKEREKQVEEHDARNEAEVDKLHQVIDKLEEELEKVSHLVVRAAQPLN